MLAGVSQVCITPPVGVDLTGFIFRKNPSTGVHDDLYARGLFLAEGGEKLLWLHLDLIGLARDRVASLRRAIGRELSLEDRQIVVSCTHTHSGPATIFLRGCGQVDPAYMESLNRRVLEAARQAAERAQPVTLRFTEGRCLVGVDRRKPSGHSHVDPRLPVLALVRPDGALAAVLANYAAHNVMLPEDTRHVSAGMFGLAAEMARQELPGRPVTLLTAGACGNINPAGLGDKTGTLQRHAEELKRVICSAANDATPAGPATLASAIRQVEVPLDIPTAEQVDRQWRAHQEKTRGDSPTARRVLEAMRSWRDETLKLLAAGAPKSLAADVQAVRIGPVCFAAMGAEVFSRMADDLRQAVGANTYVVGYAGGDFGYLPPPEVYAEGGYEVDTAHKYYGCFRVAAGAFEVLRDAAIQLLRQCDEGLACHG